MGTGSAMEDADLNEWGAGDGGVGGIGGVQRRLNVGQEDLCLVGSAGRTLKHDRKT